MKKTGTLFLKAVLVVLGLAVLALCIFGVFPIVDGAIGYVPNVSYLKIPILIDLWITGILFFFALYSAYKLLTYIDENKAFSELSVKALKHIKYCGIAISVLYVVCMPLVLAMAEKDDAPGAVLIGLVLALSPLVVSVFATVLQKLLQNGMEIKSENDLTV